MERDRGKEWIDRLRRAGGRAQGTVRTWAPTVKAVAGVVLVLIRLEDWRDQH
ncbi:hypothetical protein ACFW1A_25020 [Kitasatospora sp. NPDC058965]|uniref:hypothetical protein n=1 Tax=Kitasatospora sp. NPDC058965 TaxID=3346682 RepID=UPI003683E6A8